MENNYARVMEVVENKVAMVYKNDYVLKEEVINCAIDIFVNGNTQDTEDKLIDVLTNEDNKDIRDLAQNIGMYMIEKIINKEYMENLIKTRKDEINEHIVEGIRNDLEVLCLQDVEDMEVISQCQYDNLIKEDDLSYGDVIIKTKTYISRMTVEDGMEYDNQVSVEIWLNGNLEDTVRYECIPF